MNNFLIWNTLGLLHAVVDDAVTHAQSMVDPETIQEIWLAPEKSVIYVFQKNAVPCTVLSYDYAREQLLDAQVRKMTCQ